MEQQDAKLIKQNDAKIYSVAFGINNRDAQNLLSRISSNYQADCINNKLKMLAGSKYNNKKESVNAMSWEEDNVKWEYIIPETVGNVYRNAVCSGWRPEVKSEKEK